MYSPNCSMSAVYKWEDLDSSLPNANIPCFYRSEQPQYKDFISSRIVTQIIKFNYQIIDYKELKKDFVAVYCTQGEADLLNNVNIRFNYVYGRDLFTTRDQLISLQEFYEFYTLLKRILPLKFTSNYYLTNYHKPNCQIINLSQFKQNQSSSSNNIFIISNSNPILITNQLTVVSSNNLNVKNDNVSPKCISVYPEQKEVVSVKKEEINLDTIKMEKNYNDDDIIWIEDSKQDDKNVDMEIQKEAPKRKRARCFSETCLIVESFRINYKKELKKKFNDNKLEKMDRFFMNKSLLSLNDEKVVAKEILKENNCKYLLNPNRTMEQIERFRKFFDFVFIKKHKEEIKIEDIKENLKTIDTDRLNFIKEKALKKDQVQKTIKFVDELPENRAVLSKKLKQNDSKVLNKFKNNLSRFRPYNR
ncbi:unnamed protein product [Brachionus calyciflorus]|uniref:Uncharacterized protein n=1 Tax=Brachionus calyciflorus TaxID=104777 RepID=A0A814JEV8_9BILA|nr:unnamed protein product [Brachionus calyciflorus]